MLRLFKGLRPFRTSVVFIMILTIIGTLTDLFLPMLMAKIVDIGIVNNDIGYIVRVGGLMLGVTAVGVGSALYTNYLGARLGNGFARDLRNKIFKKVESFSLSEFDDIGTSSLITRTTNDVSQIQNIVIASLRIFIKAPLMAIGGTVMAVSKNLKLSVIIILVVTVLNLIMVLVARRIIPMFKARQKKLDKLNLVLRERLTGIRVIRAFNKVDTEIDRFNNSNKELTDISLRVNRLIAILSPIMMLIFSITTVVVTWLGAYRVNDSNMLVGDLMAFIQYITLIMSSLLMIAMIFFMVPRAFASATRINEVLDKQPSIKDNPKTLNDNEKRGYLEFKNVTFRYDNAEEPAVENISFKSDPGEVTAIIGGTGSGKSTIVNLLLRFYEASEGNILINDMDIRDMNQKKLRDKIGLVPQKALLFTGSVADNVKFGLEDINDQDIIKACQIAQADDFVNKMDDKYQSEIAQGGRNLSGGQKQRLSIARALAKKPQIYVFDDSFSALDFKTEAKLRKALKEETADSSVIIVAQKVSSVMDADRILVLDNGKIAGVGKHKELINTCDVYKQIVLSQLSEEELA
ncbi:ABC transporter ATP-binding protein [Clostridiaceae bacterium M8S5]|nr:ABC transporter ATP-binding protein [Clostridiaceae bacterium M8S5]